MQTETGHEEMKPDTSHFRVAFHTQQNHKASIHTDAMRKFRGKKGTGSCYCSQQTFQEHFTGRVMTSLKMTNDDH